MLIEKKSPLNGEWNVMDLPVTEEQLTNYKNGQLAQDVFPHLSPSEREFIISGITPKEWVMLFGEVE
jgi:hypothetical protein